jgi:hypothetical protein
VLQRPHEDPDSRFWSDSPSTPFRWMRKLMIRIENTKRMDSATDRGPDMSGFGFSLGFMGLDSWLAFGIL